LHHPPAGVALAKDGNQQVNILDTERLFLRHLRADDADFILEPLNEPAFLQNIGDRGVRNIADACRYIVAGPVASYQQFGFGLYLVALKETAVPIGICGLLKREFMKDIEIGFAFLERFWAKGYAYESAAAMDYARTSLAEAHRGDHRAPGNRGSIRVLEKLGLRFEGRLRLPGPERETSLYALEG
jgi:[ribosomal protein S5]-alanine N-acetyltransferase